MENSSIRSYADGNKNRYMEYLLGKSEWREEYYVDPDGTYNDLEEESFYVKLVKYIEKRAKKDDDLWKYSIAIPKAGADGGYEVPPGIRVSNRESNETIMYLRADQLGYSVPKRDMDAWDDKYIYGAYLGCKRGQANEGEVQKVADIIWITRSLGGCFLWPIVKRGKRWCSFYNVWRGVKSYIEDSADLTLLEIKCFYDVWTQFKENNVDEEILIDKIREKMIKEGYKILACTDYREIAIWLMHFKSFLYYISFFSMDAFVVGDSPLDMSKPEKEILLDTSVKRWRYRRIKENMTKKEKGYLLENLRCCVTERTKQMEAFIIN